MHRPQAFIALAALACFAIAAPASVLGSDVEAQARLRLGRNEAVAAVELLEDALPSATQAERPGLVATLKEAYAAAILQADAAGRTEEAHDYRENLGILDRKAPAPPASPAPSPETPQAMEEPPALPEPAPPPASDPSIKKASLAEAIAPAPEAALPALLPEPAKLPPPAAERPQPKPSASLPPAPDVSKADAAFRSKDYAAAGKLYGELVRAKTLPTNRQEQWAYCRWVEIVKRINAKPRTAEEWDKIHADLAEIKAPNSGRWFAEYLRKRVAATNPPRRKPDTSRTIVRGASPDDSAGTPPPMAPRAAELPRTNDVAPETGTQSSAPAPQQSQQAPDWVIRETPSFVIHHVNPELAEKVADLAERAKDALARRWTGAPATAPWNPRCEIYLYPDGKVFAALTGQAEESPGFSTMGMNNGKIIGRRINLRADHPDLVGAVLPHELTHVVLADLFPKKQIPRWADEGIAVLSEPLNERDKRTAELTEPLSKGQVFRVNDLLELDYPSPKHWTLFYAQSVSLTQFLVEQSSPGKFIDFLRTSQVSGTEPALLEHYGIQGLSDLETRWLEYARARPPQQTARAETPTATK
ncbi:hypothetical protein EP7_001062 [Isosphaeraceae bacterium EP7]